jgi:hypothetical protein
MPPPNIGSDPYVEIYRVVDAIELAYLQSNGDYGMSPNQSGKYFALTLSGARAFAGHPVNAGCEITIMAIPRTVLNLGHKFNDPGPFGAGASVYFDDTQLPAVYGKMTTPVVM